MAGEIPTNLLSTYDVGSWFTAQGSAQIHHEDYIDVLTILDSTQVPFFSGAPKTRAKDRVHSWSIDTLDAVATGGAAVGTDFGGDTFSIPKRLTNFTQIFRKDVIVDDGERESNPAGINDMFDHQMSKKFKVNMRNCEARLFVSVGASASASGAEATASPPLMSPFLGNFAVNGTVKIVTAASAATVSAGITSLLQTMFNAGAEPDSVWLAPSRKVKFVEEVTSNGTVNVRNIAADDNRLIFNIDAYETPLGQVVLLIADRFISMNTGGDASASGFADFVGDRSMAKLAFFRPPQVKEMGKNGDHTRALALFECCLQLAHPSSWGAVTGVTGASALAAF